MFKRFSANYMALLFVLDGVLIQFSLWLALRMRFSVPLGDTILPEWFNIYFFVPDVSLHLSVGIIWAAGFLVFGVYTPRSVIHWHDEFQRILLAQTVAALSLAGMLYLINIDLSRLLYGYFYLIGLVLSDGIPHPSSDLASTATDDFFECGIHSCGGRRACWCRASDRVPTPALAGD